MGEDVSRIGRPGDPAGLPFLPYYQMMAVCERLNMSPREYGEEDNDVIEAILEYMIGESTPSGKKK